MSEQGYDEQGFDPGGESFADDGAQQLDPWLDPDAYREEIRGLVAEQVTAERGERERLTAAAQEARELVAGHAGELGFEADYAEVERRAESEVREIASELLAREGLGPQQAEQFLGDGGFQVVSAAYGIGVRELVELALRSVTQSAFVAAPVRGDESAVLAKYQRLARAQQQGRSQPRPAQSAPYPGWAQDLVNRV